MTTIERVSVYSSTPTHQGELCSHTWLTADDGRRVEIGRYTPEMGWSFATAGRKWGDPVELGYRHIRQLSDPDTVAETLATLSEIRATGNPNEGVTFGMFS